jgi:hypothetical protein
MGPKFQKSGLVLENQALRHYRVRIRLSNSEYGEPIRQRTKVQGLREIRPFKLHFSSLEVIGFKVRMGENLNELNSKI